jgi:transposase-like protein
MPFHVFFLLAVLVASLPAQAQDCTPGNGMLGDILYNGDYGVFQGCTPSGWKAFRRCFRAVDMLPSHRGRETPIGVRRAMITQVLHCLYCHGTDIVRHGTSPEGKQRYRCRQCLEGRGRTFLLEYAYAGQSPAIKEQIVDMAMNASGIRDTARVLHVSPTTVIKELKKRNLTSNK